MKYNNYKKNKYYCNKLNANCYNNIYSNYKYNNFVSPLNNLFEVENFLCNIKKISKAINLYKFFK